MTEKELRRLSRGELLEMLVAQIEENEKLQQRLAEAEAQLEERRIAIARSGTMAEAALRLNGVFEAADRAVRQYLGNIAESLPEEMLTRALGGEEDVTHEKAQEGEGMKEEGGCEEAQEAKSEKE